MGARPIAGRAPFRVGLTRYLAGTNLVSVSERCDLQAFKGPGLQGR